MNIRGISAFYHDSAACLVCDGEIVAAAQEERFTRKNIPGFPIRLSNTAFVKVRLTSRTIRHLVFYDKPLVKFERLLETYLAFAPRGFQSFVAAMPVWLKEKLLLKRSSSEEFLIHDSGYDSGVAQDFVREHHESHAASAFFPSPFEKAVVLCIDGVGEWSTTSAGRAQGSPLNMKEIRSRTRSACSIRHSPTTRI